MSNQDRYIPGVPCWIDTTQPDPEAAVAFYGDLFGWQVEDVMPPESPARYFVARLEGGDVAAVSSQPEGGQTAWNTYMRAPRRREDGGEGRSRGRQRAGGADGRRRCGPHGRVRRPGGRRVQR